MSQNIPMRRRPLPLIVESLEDRSVPALISGQLTLTPPTLTPGQVMILLERASVATASNDAIIAVVDRGGNLLGVLTESGVSAALLANPDTKAFAIDGAIAEARTAAFFANDTAPLTSRTIQFISQSSITQREVDSNPDVDHANPDSTTRGPRLRRRRSAWAVIFHRACRSRRSWTSSASSKPIVTASSIRAPIT